MKNALIILAVLFLAGCAQPQAPRLQTPEPLIIPPHPDPSPSPPIPAVLAERIAQPAQTPQIADKPAIPELGAVDLDIYAYGANDVGGSARLNTPLEYRILAAQARAGSPPLTSAFDVTIFLTVIHSDGTFDLFGTANVPGILPSNQFTYDPAKERWVNDKGLAQGKIGPQRFVGIVNWNGQTKQIGETVNVR
ncbi:hypothetical protein C4580_05965 [Candidatus Woesearchaeota archaeon]|nr:MAG: hypothetical protein C4580_05965 [Candidatus Woesearchaeota archaeon]